MSGVDYPECINKTEHLHTRVVVNTLNKNIHIFDISAFVILINCNDNHFLENAMRFWTILVYGSL